MPRVLTAGHSTRTLEEFLQLLGAHAVDRLIDIRTVPRSRRHPQFNRDTLPQALAPIAIRTWPAWAGCASRGRSPPTPAGATIRSAATPTTCRRPRSRRRWPS